MLSRQRRRPAEKVGRRLTPFGGLLAVALVTLAVLTVVAPSPGIVMGLIAVILVWALVLASSFPSASGRGVADQSLRASDFGAEAEAERRRTGAGE